VRFRYHAALAVAGVVTLIAGIPLAASGWYLAPILLVPLAVAVWAWRAGTDADRDGLVVRALLGSRRIAWSEVAELTTDARGRALARLDDGRGVPLTAVTAADLPRLAASSGTVAGTAGTVVETGTAAQTGTVADKMTEETDKTAEEPADERQAAG
jgi:hypothetical protein